MRRLTPPALGIQDGGGTPLPPMRPAEIRFEEASAQWSKTKHPVHVRVFHSWLGGGADLSYDGGRSIDSIEIDMWGQATGVSVSYSLDERLEAGVRVLRDRGHFDADLNGDFVRLSGRGDFERTEVSALARYEFFGDRVRAFVQGGFGGGTFDVEGLSSVPFASVGVGPGIEFQITNHVALEVGGEIAWRAWPYRQPGNDALFSEVDARVWAGFTVSF
ncbi:MAG: outer membrane beta-barrel protein [Planctomycetes bacterium]|nr:outer membrane beta-barrel protein [Planctomycetota bacterium]